MLQPLKGVGEGWHGLSWLSLGRYRSLTRTQPLKRTPNRGFDILPRRSTESYFQHKRLVLSSHPRGFSVKVAVQVLPQSTAPMHPVEIAPEPLSLPLGKVIHCCPAVGTQMSLIRPNRQGC